ncbi:MAG: hypothetical protein C4K48_02990 [Candidatus Thorarchaeota archaeon]|nr:MAG: hypothetical protein C4K48_02990 [Candidatus Thorarchaeota archaeon]
MIASGRFQNIIIVLTIAVAIISSGFIVTNASYYGGTYVLAERLEVSLAEIHVSNVDPGNSSVNPLISLAFNMRIDVQAVGNVRVTFLGATLWLNNDLLSYTSFSHSPTLVDQYLHSDYDSNVTMSQSVTDDRQTVLDAYLSSTWAWNVTLRYSFIVFDVRDTIAWRSLEFYTTEFTLT